MKKPELPTDAEEATIRRGIEEDPDAWEPSDEELDHLRPAEEVLPEVLAAWRAGTLKRRRGQRGPQKRPTKQQVSIRFSPEVLAHFRATGRGWQTRMDEALKQWIAEHGQDTDAT